MNSSELTLLLNGERVCRSRVEPIPEDRSSRVEPIHEDRRSRVEPIHEDRRSRVEPIHEDRTSRVEPIHEDRRSRVEPIHEDPMNYSGFYIDIHGHPYRDRGRMRSVIHLRSLRESMEGERRRTK